MPIISKMAHILLLDRKAKSVIAIGCKELLLIYYALDHTPAHSVPLKAELITLEVCALLHFTN